MDAVNIIEIGGFEMDITRRNAIKNLGVMTVAATTPAPISAESQPEPESNVLRLYRNMSQFPAITHWSGNRFHHYNEVYGNVLEARQFITPDAPYHHSRTIVVRTGENSQTLVRLGIESNEDGSFKLVNLGMVSPYADIPFRGYDTPINEQERRIYQQAGLKDFNRWDLSFGLDGVVSQGFLDQFQGSNATNHWDFSHKKNPRIRDNAQTALDGLIGPVIKALEGCPFYRQVQNPEEVYDRVSRQSQK